MIGTSGFNNGGEDGGGRVLPFARDYEAEEGLGFWTHSVVAEDLGHGAIGGEGVAEGRLRSKPVEEGAERKRRKRIGVEVDEVDKVIGYEGREETLE